jgi:hypothetical protein
MTRTIKALSSAAMLIACALPITAVSAQDSAAARNGRMSFDPNAVVTLTGATVIRVDTLKRADNPTITAMLSSGTDSISATIAPVTFLVKNSLTLAAGDVIDISGATLMIAGKPSLITTEIKKGEARLVLRDKSTGIPAWSEGMGMMHKP